MILKMNGPLRIEDLRHHPAETVDRLRCLLMAGAHATPDRHRKSMYELEDGDRAFYIHVSPTGRVLLLAIWRRGETDYAALPDAPLAEAVVCCG